MRRVLQLRTSQSQPGDHSQLAGVKGEIKLGSPAPKIRFREPQIEMAHGAGGKASRRLVEGLFAPLLFGASTEPLADAAHLKINGARMAVTTDSFVVKPLVFPGGSIGELAINGTVNDLAVSGAKTGSNRCHVYPRIRFAHRNPPTRNSGHGRRRSIRRRSNRRWRYESRRARQSRQHVHHHHRSRRSATGS